MKISDILKTKATISFEVFPPKNKEGDISSIYYTIDELAKLNPDFIIDDLVLVHFDHNDNMTVYHLPYLKTEVEKMLAFYKKELKLEESAKKRKRIEY